MLVGERLGDVVVGPLVEGLDRRLYARIGGHDDAHQFMVPVAQASEQFDAVAAAGQVEVENRDVDLFALEDVKRELSRRRFENLVAVAARELQDGNLRALAELAVDPDGAPVGENNALAQRQAKSDA